MESDNNGKVLLFRTVHCPKCGERLLYQIEPINGTIRVKCSDCKTALTMSFENGVLIKVEYNNIKEICVNE